MASLKKTVDNSSFFDKRFWVERSERFELNSFGYLADPEVPTPTFFSPINNHLKVTKALVEEPCLILLGEPGIGKSFELEALKAQSEALSSGEPIVLRVDLKGRSDFRNIEKLIFETMAFKRWLNSEQMLHLFVDSLDECALHIDTLGQRLADIFTRRLFGISLPTEEYEKLRAIESDLSRVVDPVSILEDDQVRINTSSITKTDWNKLAVTVRRNLEARSLVPRLKLRVACRVSEWESSFYPLREALKSVWESELKVLELTPLRRTDVETAATRSSVDSDQFLEAVEPNAVPLATKPQRLKMLLSIFRETGSLPDDLVDLYEQGCLFSCTEQEVERRQRQNLNPDERLAIASRISAISILASRGRIFVGADFGFDDPDRVNIADLTGFHERVREQKIEVREPDIREVLATSLFRSAEDNYLTLEHQTIAEFLAARYLNLHALNPKQKLDIVLHPDDPDGWVTPQLREVALWLARMDGEVLELLLEREPNLLIQTDLELPTEQRKLLIDKLLSLIATERVSPATFESTLNYRRLAHPEIAEQLRPYITDTSLNENARWTAMEMARASDAKPLQDELLTIALDVNQDHHLRVVATSVLEEIVDEDVQAALRPIALKKLPNDEDDELRGLALGIAWPDAVSLDEILETLVLPTDQVVLECTCRL